MQFRLSKYTAACLALIGMALNAMFAGSPAKAQTSGDICSGIPGLTINAGFEQPDINTTTPATIFTPRPTAATNYDQGDVNGWSTTAADGQIEIWQSGALGVPSYRGAQHAEINANIFSALFQDVQTTPGTEIIWSFAHRGRAGVDTVRVEMGAPGAALVSQGTFSTGNTDWDVKSGRYIVPAGQTVTRFQFVAVSTASGNASVGNFIDEVILAPLCDFGDAPSSFPVLRDDQGAAHRISVSAFLGSGVDPEVDGQPSALADGDDLNGSDDEDGVQFGAVGDGNVFRAASNLIQVTASAPGFINAWVDFNGDGAWGAGEQIFADQPVSVGTQSLNFTVPPGAIAGATNARVRYSTDNPAGQLGPTGSWANGEVEDSRLTILAAASLLVAKSSEPFVDGGAGTGSGLFLPGDDVLYTISVSNVGDGDVIDDTVFVVDTLPDDLIFFNGDANGSAPGTARVLVSANSSNLTFNEGTDLAFSDAATPPADFAACTFSPSAGYDSAIRHICLNPKGSFAAGTPAPEFTVQFRAQIK